ncbi:MAG: hypothetical protein ABJB11_14420 [Ferruginibacter sp.]
MKIIIESAKTLHAINLEPFQNGSNHFSNNPFNTGFLLHLLLNDCTSHFIYDQHW